VTERKIIVNMQSDERPKPFWDRHFTPILALLGVIVAAVLAMSETGLKLFVNQPPDVQLKLSEAIVTQGKVLVARALASDPDSLRADLRYRWEIFDSDKVLREGDGPSFSRLELPTSQLGKFIVLVTVTDKLGSGKHKTADAQYEVIAPPGDASPLDRQPGPVTTDDFLSLGASQGSCRLSHAAFC
jgi:hypothetical protein